MRFWFSNKSDAKHTFPTQPRKVKRWLKELPLANFGETGRQFFNGLKSINQQDIPAKQRFIVMEAMRPMATMVLLNLRKHLVARSLPLPPPTSGIMQLQQILLAEMAMGYKIIIQQLAKDETRLNPKTTAICIHRAIRYLGEKLLQNYQVYSPTPAGIWQNLYQLYLFAEKHALIDKPIKDDTHHEVESSSIQDVFKQILLLPLAKPSSLRQGEVTRLALFFETALLDCRITESPVSDSMDNIYFVNTNLDSPPEYAVKNDIAISTSNRYLDLSQLIQQINSLTLTAGSSQDTAASRSSTLNTDLALRLLKNLTTNPKRRFTRGEKNTMATVAIGLLDIYNTIQEDKGISLDQKGSYAAPAELDLMLMPADEYMNINDNYIIAPNSTNTNTSIAWDIVAKGSVVSDTAIKIKSAPPEPKKELIPSNWQSWEIVNASAGGYNLRWKESQSSKAYVGELVALREAAGAGHHWRIGVIRWMQYKEDHGLEIGIELLAPEVIIATAQPIKPGYQNREESARVLLLPRINVINQPPRILALAGKFKQGEAVSIKTMKRKFEIEITELCDHSVSFCEFNYVEVSAEENPSDKTDSDETQELEAIWSAL